MMKPPADYVNHDCVNRSLESRLVVPPQVQPRRSKWHFIQKQWQRLLTAWQQNDELQIWQSCDRLGVLRWSAYDPQTGKQIHQVSETEMRIWLEQRNFITKPDRHSRLPFHARIHPSR